MDVIEQITYLMFIHDLDESDTRRAKESAMLGLPFQSIFTKEVEVGDRKIDGSQLKLSKYCSNEGNIYTESLGELAYQNNPRFKKFIMDNDHAGGFGLVRDAKRIMASDAENAVAQKGGFRYLKRLWQDITIENFPDEETDLLGDGTITLMPFHGHSAGMTAVKVGADKFVVIAGDAGYGRESWEKLVLPGITWNKAEALASLKRLQQYGQDENCLAVLMTHDSEQEQEVCEL